MHPSDLGQRFRSRAACVEHGGELIESRLSRYGEAPCCSSLTTCSEPESLGDSLNTTSRGEGPGIHPGWPSPKHISRAYSKLRRHPHRLAERLVRPAPEHDSTPVNDVGSAFHEVRLLDLDLSHLGIVSAAPTQRNVGHHVGRSTIRRILKAAGLRPVPQRPTSWHTFLKAHWGAIAGADLFTIEVWTLQGLLTYYTVFVIDLASRRVQILGSTPHPEGVFMQQIVRTLTMAEHEALDVHVLICGRDRKWVRVNSGTRTSRWC